MPVRAKILIPIVAAIGLGAVGATYLWFHLAFYNLTRHWSPIHKVDVLQSPVSVASWSQNGLHLTDGRTLQLPGFRGLPEKSDALTETTKRGVEIGGDGRVYGLISVHHWCGNDPVREHIARVDIADMLMFLGEGDWTKPPSPEALKMSRAKSSRGFSEWGWNVSDFMWFQGWSRDE